MSFTLSYMKLAAALNRGAKTLILAMEKYCIRFNQFRKDNLKLYLTIIMFIFDKPIFSNEGLGTLKSSVDLTQGWCGCSSTSQVEKSENPSQLLRLNLSSGAKTCY